MGQRDNIVYKMPKEIQDTVSGHFFKFKAWGIIPIKERDKEHQEIEKEPDPMNSEDLPEYIWFFTHLFNKKKFEKIPERQKWDHKINLLEDATKDLNIKAYTMMVI